MKKNVLNIKPVKLIIGLLYSDNFLEYENFINLIANIFGEIDKISSLFPFNYTDYYKKEFGNSLNRRFLSFEDLVSPEKLSEIKIITNKLENKFSKDHKRTINIDPGYLDLDKFILASAKYGRQKIYINKGIYADPVLEYYKKSFNSFNWSFPDFKSNEYFDFFSKARNIYRKQIKDFNVE
ncbi:MAG: DUF4416 family protein [Candidatus Marinimicrobia bacterium]|nr:DUF4416 family protein [Candidatus Neomarinimicrobiota bacterium]